METTDQVKKVLLYVMEAGGNIAITGIQGAGKTFYAKSLIDNLPQEVKDSLVRIDDSTDPTEIYKILDDNRNILCEHYAKDTETFNKTVEFLSAEVEKSVSRLPVVDVLTRIEKNNIVLMEESSVDGSINTLVKDNTIISKPIYLGQNMTPEQKEGLNKIIEEHWG